MKKQKKKAVEVGVGLISGKPFAKETYKNGGVKFFEAEDIGENKYYYDENKPLTWDMANALALKPKESNLKIEK